ncbi:MAG TPA: ParB/RepB/Spo0J family partition protein [Candidatus Acidoferrales bacterium]|nr:ParB/RepB/Spo0J family partition protein [Candidatus Acidoferrales bacterium]
MSKRIGLPVTLKMRHDAHYVESLTAYSSASIGRMLPLDKVQPNPEQPRKTLGDLRELTESIREKGVLEPLLVRFNPRENLYYIISGERRFHAARAAGLREVPCIEKVADDAESLEIALIENLQRKDLTPFEEAEGLARLAQQFDLTHDEIARKIGRSRVGVTETLTLCAITPPVRKKCLERAILSKSLLLQIARQPNEKKMLEMVERIARGGLTRDEARAERRADSAEPARPRPFRFRYEPETKAFRLNIEFQKSQITKAELVLALRAALSEIEKALAAESESAA